MPRLPADYARYGRELRRVRAGERADDEGGKSVWHQAAPGIEIISFVDANGRALRQECYLEERAVIWAHAQPVKTAAVQPGTRRLANDAVAIDAALDREALSAALVMLHAAASGDRYLDHLRAELEAFERGLEADADLQVTTTSGRRPKLTDLMPRKPARWPYFVGAALVAAAAVLAWRTLR